MHPVSPLTVRVSTGGPWYAHRWPWLLMVGPVVVVLGGIVTGYLSYTRQDAMVVDDYYKQGKAINQDLRRDRVASKLQLAFAAHYNPASARLEGSMHSLGRPLASGFWIHLAHSTQPAKDLHLQVRPDARGQFSVALPMLERARWQVVVEGQQRDWRLAGSWMWPQQQALEIEADAVVAQ